MAARALQGAQAARGRLGIFARLHAWWEGYDLQAAAAEAAAAAAAAQGEAAAGDQASAAAGSGPTGPRAWTPQRLAAVQKLFGPGRALPGDDDFFDWLLEPLSVEDGMSVLEYGARLATLTRHIASKSCAWLEALETDPLLGVTASRLSEEADLGQKAAMLDKPLAEAAIKPGTIDALLALERLYLEPDRAATLKQFRALLRDGGRLLLAEPMRRSGKAPGAQLEAWLEREGKALDLVEPETLRRELEGLGFAVVAEDISDRYCGELLRALKRLEAALAAEPVGEEVKVALAVETEAWALRLAALKAGQLAVYRIVATAGGPAAEGS